MGRPQDSDSGSTPSLKEWVLLQPGRTANHTAPQAEPRGGDSRGARPSLPHRSLLSRRTRHQDKRQRSGEQMHPALCSQTEGLPLSACAGSRQLGRKDRPDGGARWEPVDPITAPQPSGPGEVTGPPREGEPEPLLCHLRPLPLSQAQLWLIHCPLPRGQGCHPASSTPGCPQLAQVQEQPAPADPSGLPRTAWAGALTRWEPWPGSPSCSSLTWRHLGLSGTQAKPARRAGGNKLGSVPVGTQVRRTLTQGPLLPLATQAAAEQPPPPGSLP